MDYNEELKKIKKEYGEKFMHLCRDFFATILEHEGTLYKILDATFADNCKKSLYEDIIANDMEEDFKEFIYSKFYIKTNVVENVDNKTPYELLDKAGYDLYECTIEEEIQEFKHYYAKGEELCTFNGGRLKRCVVFFAVKKNVEDIKRKDFTVPKREDEYGTSVMGIQFTKEGICTVSIKNRYNHTVNNPDATYGNDLDRIIPGLTRSFEALLAERGLRLDNSNMELFRIANYVVANDGKMYKSNIEINQIYYCPGNVIIEFGKPKQLENPESQILMDYFILDTKEKTITIYDETIKDCFIDEFQDIEKIKVQKKPEKDERAREIIIYKKDIEKPVIIEIDKNNQIIGYKNETVKKIRNNFLVSNWFLNRLELPNVEIIGDSCLLENRYLSEVSLKKLWYVGDDFLCENQYINNVDFPELQIIGNGFLYNAEILEKIDLPNVEKIGSCFLYNNKWLKEIKLPEVKEIGEGALSCNVDLRELELLNVTNIGNKFLHNNRRLKKAILPKLKKVGNDFLFSNNDLIELELLSLEEVGRNFLSENGCLERFIAPNLTKAGEHFLWYTVNLEEFIISDDIDYRGNTKTIDSYDISRLDRDTRITEHEILRIRKMVEVNKEDKSLDD